MIDLFKEHLSFPCPSCGRRISVTIKETEKILICPYCGYEIEYTTKPEIEEAGDADKTCDSKEQ